MSDQQIEQQLTVLLRRNTKIHLVTSAGEVNVERSSYGILAKLADEGPQRLGALAAGFGLDPSTITRQVQALEELDLVAREKDPTDGRASVLDLTEEGRRIFDGTRARRRARLAQSLEEWPEEERLRFAELLAKFNTAMEQLISYDGG